MKAVFVVDKPEIAQVLVDPMRRTILTLLREKPMTQAQLANKLDLSDPSLNYHMKILKKYNLVIITKKVVEEHGILQKFFAPSTYLLVYDLESLPLNIARYFYPISIERARTLASFIMIQDPKYKPDLSSEYTNKITEEISKIIVSVAKSFKNKEVQHNDERIVYDIYQRVIKQFLDTL
jgi:DNA-binding transcriptional ArsR family regulator